MRLDLSFCAHLRELVVTCDQGGLIAYANPAAQRWAPEPLCGRPFTLLLSPETAAKGRQFLAAAGAACAQTPCEPWELTLSDATSYSVASFRGYREGDTTVLLGEVEPAEMGLMQRELLELTSELGEAQREQRRQNRQLELALEEHRRLLETIQELAAPAVPVWERVLLLPLFGHFDSRRAELVNSQLLTQVVRARAVYAILDLSGIAMVDTAVARQLLETAAALRLLGVQAILVGINPEIAQTIVNLGVQMPGFVLKSDLRGAMAYVLARLRPQAHT